MTERHLRIHGDNIVECERTLKMIVEAFNAECILQQSPLYFPKYRIQNKTDNFVTELLSGHGRWGVDVGSVIIDNGGKLAEKSDSYISEVKENKETILLGIEYCSALPAGNNAWQRNGRALSSVLVNIPYLYYTEIGGVELDENRTPKSSRFPNPVVPFSYISLTEETGKICLPVYNAHPSMSKEFRLLYNAVFGYNDGLEFIRNTINKEDTTVIKKALRDKALKLVQILSRNRKYNDTLQGNEWKRLLEARNKTRWLLSHEGEHLKWEKKNSSKLLVSRTFNALKNKVIELGARPIASSDLPFCIIPQTNLQELKSWMRSTYKEKSINFSTNKDMVVVWITGFKPHGDDSRPDRGLAPLCRMLLGLSANIMAVIYGPAKSDMWGKLKNSPEMLCKDNGLFQAIFAYCNYLFVDSATSYCPIFTNTKTKNELKNDDVAFEYIENPSVEYSEHDTDCAIHQIFSRKEELGIYESFCNPPGGDWSGITVLDDNHLYKWTSLPRVSKSSKRPDHIIQIISGENKIFVVIESKENSSDLEPNIGVRLADYISEMFRCPPTAYKDKESNEWGTYNGSTVSMRYSLVSVGAFLYKNDEELQEQLTKGNLDAVIAFEFNETSILHFISLQQGNVLLKYIQDIASKQGTFVVKVH